MKYKSLIKTICIYFVLQEKRGNREKEKLEKLQSQTNEMKDKYMEETHLALDSFLANVQAKCK